MPTKRRRLSKEEQVKFRALILRLQKAGIATGTSGEPLSVPKRLDIRQPEYFFSRVHHLPGSQVTLVLQCELMALRAGATIRDCAISLPWGPELDLSDPEYTPWYNDVIQGWPSWPPTVLNRWLTGEASLPRGKKLAGIVIATGWSPIPAGYPDEWPVDIELAVSDDCGNELNFTFRAGLDRTVKHVYERKCQARIDAGRLTKRRKLFELEEERTLDQDRATLEQDRGSISSPPAVALVVETTEGSQLLSSETKGT